MDIKLIGIDLDGTLLNDNKEISIENINAIKNATNLGIKVIIATGRPLNEIVIKYHKTLGLFNSNQEFIGYNGTAMFNVYSGNAIIKHMMKKLDVLRIFSFSENLGAACYAYCSDVLLYNHLNEYVLMEKYYNNSTFEQINLCFLNDDFECFKVMIAEEKSVLDKIEELVPEDIKRDYTILRSMDYFLEFIPKEANKFNALLEIAKRYNISNEEIMAIGDSMNDFPFISAGVSVAMENSVEKIKQSFRYTTLSNNHSGVAHIINKLILNQKH